MPIINAQNVKNNAGKIQNLLRHFGGEAYSLTKGVREQGAGFHEGSEIAKEIANAEAVAAQRLGIFNKQQQTQQTYETQRQYPVQYSNPVQFTQNVPVQTNFNYNNDMSVDISKYIGSPTQQVSQQKNSVETLIAETNAKLEALCKIVGLLYQDNKQLISLLASNSANSIGQQFISDAIAQQRASIEEDEELVPLPVIDPMAEDEEDINETEQE